MRTSKRARMTRAGAFVYQGSGKRQDPNAPPEQRICVNESVAIQRCMSRNGSNQNRCQWEVEKWKACCKRVKEGERATKDKGTTVPSKVGDQG